MLLAVHVGCQQWQQKSACSRLGAALKLWCSHWAAAMQGLLAMPGVAVPFPVCLPEGVQHDEAYDRMRGTVGGYSVGYAVGGRLPEKYVRPLGVVHSHIDLSALQLRAANVQACTSSAKHTQTLCFTVCLLSAFAVNSRGSSCSAL